MTDNSEARPVGSLTGREARNGVAGFRRSLARVLPRGITTPAPLLAKPVKTGYQGNLYAVTSDEGVVSW